MNRPMPNHIKTEATKVSYSLGSLKILEQLPELFKTWRKQTSRFNMDIDRRSPEYPPDF